MRFIHLSDLHIGRQLHQYNLKEDQEHILGEVVEYARMLRPDAIVIAGDVYDKSVPSAEAVGIFDWFLTALSALKPEIPILIISGNHDSAQRIDYVSGILGQKGIYIAGKLPQNREEFLKKVTLLRFDYAALGHLHSAQKVGRESVRYPGTLLKYSVSECNQTKSLHLVTLKEKGAPVEVETYPLHPLRDVKKFRGTLKELLKTVPEEAKEDYVSITLTDETDPYRPKEQLEKVFSHILEVRMDNSRTRQKLMKDAEVVRMASPLEIFGDFFQEMQGRALNAEGDEQDRRRDGGRIDEADQIDNVCLWVIQGSGENRFYRNTKRMFFDHGRYRRRKDNHL